MNDSCWFPVSDVVNGRARGGRGWRVRSGRVVGLVLVLLVSVVVPVGAVEGVLTPTGLSASSVEGGVLLEWDAPEADSGSVTGYRIVRRRTDVGETRLLQLVPDTGTTSTSYLDESVVDGGAYIYRVRAMRGGERSAISDKATIVYEVPEVEVPEPEFEEVWSSVLTVETLVAGVPGYQSYMGPSYAQGSLSPDRFTVDDESFRVMALFNHAGLVFGLSHEPPRDFVLRAGGQEFVASESMVQSMGTAQGRYWWPTDSMGWTEGDEVELSIAVSVSGSKPERALAPPSGVFDVTPGSHDGVSSFKVQLLFDEKNLPVTAGKLRDHALVVVGADITGVRKTGSNRWFVTLQPTGVGAVTITLPETTDCAQPDAICASDGRKLRAEVRAEVAGPGLDVIPEDYLLPDLVSDPPTFDYGMKEVSVDGQQRLVLRFDGYVTNLGDGPVDLSGNPQLADPSDPTSHDVWQRVKTASGDWFKLAQPPVRFETADGHNHFHLMEIVAYSLWSSDGATQVAPGAKVGFCLADSEPLPHLHPDPGPDTYSVEDSQNCMANEPNATSLEMGVTEGWRDIYDGDVTFQWIDVSDVRPGRYRIGVEADPYNILIESDETNNGVALSDRVSVVTGYEARDGVSAGRQDFRMFVRLGSRKYGSAGRAAYRIVSGPSHGTLTTSGDFTAAQGGVSFDAFTNRSVMYTPDAGFSGVDTFEFVALDSTNPAFPTNPTVATVTIDMTGANATVSIIDAPASIVAGTATSLSAEVTGAAGGVSWAVDGVDGGNTTVGTIDVDGTYTAPAAVPASGSVAVRATSTASPSAFAEAVIAITAAPNTAPAVTSPGDQSFSVGDSVDVHVVATDAQGDPLTWSVDTLPAGLDLIASTGRIVGNPTVAGASQSVVTVSDGDLSASVTLSWDISLQPAVPGDSDASLRSLDIDGAVIDPVFDPGETLYTADAAPGVSQLTVTAEAVETAHGATVSITPADADPVTAGHQIALAAGADTAIQITVTAPDTTTTQRYWLVVSDTSIPADATSALNSMQFSELETLTFDDHQNRYQMTAPPDTTHTTVVTGRADTGATVETITVRVGTDGLYADHDDADTNEPGHQVHLAETGDTLVIVRVTTSDGMSQSVYLTLITRSVDTPPASTTRTTASLRAASLKDTTDTALPELSSLTLTGAELSPVFAADAFEYGAGAAGDVEQVTIAAVAADADASVMIVPADADPDTDGWQIALGAPGSETNIVVIVSSDGQLNSYLITVARETVQTATTLESLSIDGYELTPVFDSATGLYAADVPADVSEVTIRAVATDPAAIITAVPADTDPNRTGHQAYLVEGANTVTVTVDSSDGNQQQIYTVVVDRASPVDVNLAYDGDANAVWSDGTTMWVVDYDIDAVFAFDLATGARRATKDITTLKAAGNRHPLGMWSDGITMWISDVGDSKIYAYDLATGTRRATKDINTLRRAGNGDPSGLWSDGTTMWVADLWKQTIFAYDLATGARRATKDITTLKTAAVRNDRASGIWSDGVTMWVADDGNNKVFAYDLADSTLRTDLEFRTWSSFRPFGLWSNGASMWVAGSLDEDMVYRYHMPDSSLLRSLELTDADVRFAAGRRDFAVRVPNTVTSTTVAAAAASRSNGVVVEITPADADTSAVGHQVDLATGDTTITVTVTNDDSMNATTTTYTVVVTQVDTATLSNEASLSALSLSGLNMGAFGRFTYSYTATEVSSTVSSTTVAATPTNAYSTMTISPPDSDTVTGGHQVDLAQGPNKITVTAESADGTRHRTYAVAVTRVPTHDASLSALSLSGVNMGAFSRRTTSYVAADVASTVSSTTVAATPRDADATMTISPPDSDTVTDGHQVDLAEGVNTITVTVESADTTEEQTYTVVVTRVASDDASLRTLSLSGADIGAFSGTTTSYTAAAASTKSFTTVAARSRDTNATVTISPSDSNTSRNGHQVSLFEGVNTITVTVESADTTEEQTYTVVVTRVPSDDAALSALSLSDTDIGTFSSTTTSYTAADIAGTVSSTTVVATPRYATSTVTISPPDRDSVTDGHQVDLNEGANTIKVTVSGVADTTTYTVVVSRGDIGATSTTAGVLNLADRVNNVNRSVSVRGIVDSDGDRDWYRAELLGGHRYYIDMKQTGTSNSLGDPMIVGLYDSNGDLVAGTTNDWGGETRWNDLGEYVVEEIEGWGWPFWIPPEFGPHDRGGRDAFVKFSPPQTGTYFVSVGRGASPSSNFRNGVYQLEMVERLHEIGDTPETAQRIVVGEPAVSEIDIDPWEVFSDSGGAQWEYWTGDHDWWRVTLEANRIYVIDMKGADTGHGTLSQPSMTVRPRNGSRTPINTVRIMANVEGGNDRQVFSPIVTGDYFILAIGGSYESLSAPEELGTYTLSVSVVPEEADVPATSATTAGVAVGAGAYHGRIDHGYDRDWIAVELEGGRSYQVTMGSADTSIVPISDDPQVVPVEIGGVFVGTLSVGGKFRDLSGVFDGAGNLVRGSGEFERRVIDGHGGVIRGEDYPDQIIIEPEADGVYYIEARGYDFHVGDYTITVEESFGPPIEIWTPGLQSTPFFGYLEALGSTTIELDTLTEGYAFTDSNADPIGGQVPTWYSLELVAGNTYIVNVESVGGVLSGYPFNAYIRGIFDDSGRYEYFHSAHPGQATRSQMSITPRSDGLHHIAVERRPSGDFTIIVNSTSTDSTATETATQTATQTATETVMRQRDASLSSLGVAGYGTTPEVTSDVYDYSVTVASDMSEATVDAVGTLSGTVVVASVEDLDMAPGWQVDLGAPGTETVTEIQFTSVAPNGRVSMEYTFTIIRPAPDVSAGTSTDSDLEIGVGVVSRIHAFADKNWHRVELEAGVTYQIDMEGQWTGSMSTSPPWVWISDYTLVDPILSGVYDSHGALIPGTGDLTDSGNGGTGQNSRFTFTPTVDGTYYIEASAIAAWVGTYLLTVSRISP